jgi:hypothetical protein
MPISRETITLKQEDPASLSADQIPVELYFKLTFDDGTTCSTWIQSAIKVLRETRYRKSPDSIDRPVVWGPREAFGSRPHVFVSEIALRLLRAAGQVRVPATKGPVSVSELDAGLQLYLGCPVDERVYKGVRPD